MGRPLGLLVDTSNFKKIKEKKKNISLSINIELDEILDKMYEERKISKLEKNN